MNSRLIGQRIATFRNQLGLSTADLAELIGKSQATVSRIENGKQKATIELLSVIAKALKIHPFTLLSDKPAAAAAITSRQPQGESNTESPTVCLGRVLRSARQRAHLDIAEAARALGINTENLESYENCEGLPDRKIIEKMCALYTLDGDYLTGMHHLECHHPSLCRHFSHMESLLTIFYQSLRDQGPILQKYKSDKKWQTIDKQLEQVLDIFNPDFIGAEREAEYFSIGHLSDRLLKALQNPEFHARVENMACEYEEKQQNVSEYDDTIAASEDHSGNRI